MGYLHQLRRDAVHDKAAALETIMVGACWAPDRKYKANLIPLAQNVCKLCGAQGADDYHQFWACPKLDESTWPEVLGTQRLVPKASADAMDMPCLWLRGLLPRAYVWIILSPPLLKVTLLLSMTPLA